MNHVVLIDPVTLLIRLAILALLAAGMLAGCYLFVHGFALLQRKRLILNTPRSTVRGAAIGLVEVSGQAAAPYTLISPLSQADCVYYRALAWQASGEQKRWRKVADEKLYAPFFIEDETGLLLVDLRAVQVEVPPAFAEDLLPGDGLEYMRHFLNRHGVSEEFPVKLEERCICPGDRLFVLGTLQENPKEGAELTSWRQAEPAPVSEEAADLQRQGAIEALHLSAEELANRRPPRRDPGSFDLHPPAVLGKGPHDPFIISSRSQREVALDLARQSVLYIWSGPVLALVCLWIFISRLA